MKLFFPNLDLHIFITHTSCELKKKSYICLALSESSFQFEFCWSIYGKESKKSIVNIEERDNIDDNKMNQDNILIIYHQFIMKKLIQNDIMMIQLMYINDNKLNSDNVSKLIYINCFIILQIICNMYHYKWY